MPDFTMVQEQMFWLGQALASHGFVTVVAEGRSPDDLDTPRATALAAALATLKAENERAESPVRGQLDIERAGLLGYGVGGGAVGRLVNAISPRVQCAVLWEPWPPEVSLASNDTPTAILALRDDIIAPSMDAWNRYQSIPSPTPKLFVERPGDHLAIVQDNTAEREAHVAWSLVFLKRYLESDARYEALLANPGALVRYGRTP